MVDVYVNGEFKGDIRFYNIMAEAQETRNKLGDTKFFGKEFDRIWKKLGKKYNFKPDIKMSKTFDHHCVDSYIFESEEDLLLCLLNNM